MLLVTIISQMVMPGSFSFADSHFEESRPTAESKKTKTERELDEQLKALGYEEFMDLRKKGHGYLELDVKKDIRDDRAAKRAEAARTSPLLGKAASFLGPTGYLELPSPALAPPGQFVTGYSFVRNSSTKTTWQYYSLNYGLTEDVEFTVAKYDMQVSFFGQTVTGWTTVLGAKYQLAPTRDNLTLAIGYYYGYLEKFLRGRDLGEFFGVGSTGHVLQNTHIGSFTMEVNATPALDVLFVYLYEGGGLGSDSGLNVGLKLKPAIPSFKGTTFIFELRQHRGRYDEINFGVRKDLGETLNLYIYRIQSDRRAEDAAQFSPPASGTGVGIGLRF
jgi:hypothetical protein